MALTRAQAIQAEVQCRKKRTNNAWHSQGFKFPKQRYSNLKKKKKTRGTDQGSGFPSRGTYTVSPRKEQKHINQGLEASQAELQCRQENAWHRPGPKQSKQR